MTDPDEICERLEWDSTFFGVPIARVRVSRLTEHVAHRVDEWAAAHGIGCLYFLADLGDMPTVRLAEQRGYRLVDVRIAYEVDRAGLTRVVPAAEMTAIRAAQPEDLEGLRDIARSSFRHTTRFYNDPGFTTAQCDAFYAAWIERSLQGWAAQVVTMGPAGEPYGFMTCHREGFLGLGAVRSDMRGRGIGLMLYQGALDWLAAQQIDPIRVVTQGANLTSQRLCERVGGRVANVALWYHRWFPAQP